MKPLLFFILLIFISTCYLTYKKNTIYGDGIYYVAYLQSVVLDQDLNFANNMPILKKLSNTPYIESVTPLGKTANKFPFASPLFWLPLYTLTHIALFLIYPSLANGYSFPYQLSIYISNAIFVTGTVFLLYSVLKTKFKQATALTAVCTLFFASNIFFYVAFDSINSHALSFSLSAALFYAIQDKKLRFRWPVMGLLCGLLTLNRTQDAIFIILPIALLWREFSIVNLSKLVITFTLTLIPQLILWQYLWGVWYQSPYFIVGERFSVFSPHFIELFTDSRIGLLWWSPMVVILLAYSGVAGIKKNNFLLAAICIFCLFQLFLISTWSTWYQGASFGVRMFISALPFLSYPLAELLEKTERRHRWLFFLIPGTFVLYNMGALLIFYLQ